MSKASPFKVFLIIINFIIIIALLLLSVGVIFFSLGNNANPYSFYIVDDNVKTELFNKNCFIAVKSISDYSVGDNVIYAVQSDLAEDNVNVECYISEINKIKGDVLYTENAQGVTELSADNVIGKVIFSNYPIGYTASFLSSESNRRFAAILIIAAFVVLCALVVMVHSISKLKKSKKELLAEDISEDSVNIDDLIEIEEDVLLFRQGKE